MLCNVDAKNLHNSLIEATIITGKCVGSYALLPLITREMPSNVKRMQVPILLAFAMIIKGQTLCICGLNLAFSSFSHRQLYGACSCVGRSNKLFVYAPEG